MLIYVLIYVVMYVVIYVVIYRFSRCFPLVQKNLSIVIPKSYLHVILSDFFSGIYGIYSEILSDIVSGILFGIYSGIWRSI